MDWQWPHENSRATVLEIFAIKRKLDLRMSLHTLHIVQGLSHQRERLFGKSDGRAWKGTKQAV